MSIALASAERVREILLLPAPEEEPAGLPAASFTQSIRYQGIWFRYPGTADDRWVLQDISFDVPRGRTVALVGPSGSGKTTVAELLPRLREPVRGHILLDGVPIDQCSRASVRALLGFVGQETVLFNDTVRANIAYGRPDATAEQVESAARAANAHDFIIRLPLGYDTLLGERGTRLSGGQRQRIAIARAILRDPPILILDEATSALDPESERLVQDALTRLMRDRTVLVIAHRLGTVQHADEILLLEDGQIVERGTHQHLLAREGRYAELVGAGLPVNEIQAARRLGGSATG
jgi:subfamily B ATP-binding cassette protein MsbA